MKARTRGISYFLSIMVIVTIFCSLEFITKKLVYPNDETMDVVGDIIGALLFARCKQFFDRVTDRIFFRGPQHARVKFLTNISHELQTPIAILRGNVELLQRQGITEAERASAERVIVGTLDDMSRLVGTALESAKVKFSGSTVRKQDIAVGALLWEVYEDCLLLAEDKGIRLSVDADANAEANATTSAPAVGENPTYDLFVYGDRGKLKEVMLNLISNALKYTAVGGWIVLRVGRVGATAQIFVEDSGCGIAPEVLPHIFERFYRIPHSGEHSAPLGNGIGLNICREIVEAHKGTIVAESVPGNGSRFIISLPLSLSARPREPSIGEAAPSSVSAIINS